MTIARAALAALILLLSPGLPAYAAIGSIKPAAGTARRAPAVRLRSLPARGGVSTIGVPADRFAAPPVVSLPAVFADAPRAGDAASAAQVPAAEAAVRRPSAQAALSAFRAAPADAPAADQRDAAAAPFGDAKRDGDVAGDASVHAAGAGSSAAPLAPSTEGSGGGRKDVPPPSGGGGGGDALTPKENARAVGALLWNRVFSMLAMAMTAIAYPLMVIDAVGRDVFLALGVWAWIGVPLAILAGIVAGRMPVRQYSIINIGLRSVISLVTAGLYAAGALSFWPLVLMTVLNSWQFASLFINDDMLKTKIVGGDAKNNRQVESLVRLATIFITVASGFLFGPALITHLGFAGTFLLAAALQFVPVVLLKFMLPQKMDPVKLPPLAAWPAKIAAAVLSALKGLLSRAAERPSTPEEKAKARKAALGRLVLVALFALAAVPFFLTIPLPAALLPLSKVIQHTAVPMVLVIASLLLRSSAYRDIVRPDKLLHMALGFSMLGILIEQPLRNSVLGVLADTVTGGTASAAAVLLGALVASFYLGQLPSGTGQVDPNYKIGPIPVRAAAKWLGALTVAGWIGFALLPKALLISLVTGLGLPALAWLAIPALLTLPVAAAYFKLHDSAGRIGDKQWMWIEGAALLVAGGLPLLFWGQSWALFAALAVLGFALNGSQRMISASFSAQGWTRTEDMAAERSARLREAGVSPREFIEASAEAREALFARIPGLKQELSGEQRRLQGQLRGLNGAFVNITIALTLAFYGLGQAAPALWGAAAFPFFWGVVAAVYAAIALLFFLKGGAFAREAKAAADEMKRRQGKKK